VQGESTDGYQKTTWYGWSFGIGLVTDMDKSTLNIDAAVQFIDIADPAYCLSLMIKY